MSTRTKKNDVKTTTSKPKVISKTKTSTRELSTDRRNAKKEPIEKSKITTTPKDDEKIRKPQLKPQKPKISQPQLKKTTTKKDRPVTPPSSRVTKSQYFPSKNLYSNALKREAKKEGTQEIPLSDKRKKEAIIQRNDVSSDNSSISERPRTATLRKGSIVQNNIAGPDVPRSKVPKVPQISKVAEIKRKNGERKKNTEEEKEKEIRSKREIRKKEEEATKMEIRRKGREVRKEEERRQKEIEEAHRREENIEKDIEENREVETEELKEEQYDDDFDSYESDFEEYKSSGSTSTDLNVTEISSTSSESDSELEPKKRVNSAGTDDEKNLDSGNFELPENKYRQILDNIKESTEHANIRSNTTSLSDEGFEDGKSLQFINFLGAQKKHQQRRKFEKTKKRGEEILNMIKLDTCSFTLYDSPSVPYDVFIKTFGKSNTVQASVQTGENNQNEETQTLDIPFENKWTQFPPVLTKIEDEEYFWQNYKCNYLGVGGEKARSEERSETNQNLLETFLLSAGNLILNIQGESEIIDSQSTASNVPFSKGHHLYKTQTLSFLKTSKLTDACFCSDNKILTVHGRNEEGKSFVLIWNINNSKEPEIILSVFGTVTCCTIGLDLPDMIFAGMDDGTISVWNINESASHHKNVLKETSKETEEVLTRTPTYSTEIGSSHSCKIVKIHCLDNTSSFATENVFSTNKSIEVCSLDEDGEIILWSVVFKELKNSEILGLAHWGCVIIVKNTNISLRKLYPEISDFKCTDFAVNHLDYNHLYISTNNGMIIHQLANGAKANIKKFISDSDSQINCLEVCDFSSDYLMAGFDNGDIKFYCHLTERPLMIMSNKMSDVDKSKIEMMQWSSNRPLVFYTKDVTNTIHVWNLKVSDMFPEYSIPFKDDVVCMKLSRPRSPSSVSERTFMMIATGSGQIYLHLLDNEHGQQSVESYDEDKRKFLNYINKYI